MRQIDATQHMEQRHELQRELESMVARMDKKGAQITKLRKHQQSVGQAGPYSCISLYVRTATNNYFQSK